MAELDKLRNARNLKDLAHLLGYKASALAYILYKLPDSQKYKKFKLPKRNGGEREISAPTEQLKKLQRHLANILYACCEEVDIKSKRGSISHGFRRGHSIITNARRHRGRRYVLNLDLQNFFPTFNFGRVRGFFIKNHNFKLAEKVATIIAQIACYENSLPQGSPCSPIIADLIAHVLDVRLAQLAKRHQLTYTRYADDITFSTGRKAFPAAVACPTSADSTQWVLGTDLTKAIQKAGFVINPDKTRMQLKMSRQLVTGLTVNSKVNIRQEYYRFARAMCHHLFNTGSYHRPAVGPELINSLGPIGGILSHIHHVKDTIDVRREADKRKNATAARKLYIQFLKYKYFVRLERPLIICEGKTDSIYLKCAIRRISQFYPRLGNFDGSHFNSSVRFFNLESKASRVIGLDGGSDCLKYFFIKNRYHDDIHSFEHCPLNYPVIILIDNDAGAKHLFATIKENYKRRITLDLNDQFYHIVDNLYLIKTPKNGISNTSCIEDCFDSAIRKEKVDGRSFNHEENRSNDEYGKVIFAKKVVRAKAGTIDFSGFISLFERIVAVIDHYAAHKSGSAQVGHSVEYTFG